MTSEAYMRQAITLAEGGIGFVNPNPLVGAVIVKDGRIIGEGFHERYGTPHAERNALSHCTEDPAGAEMYVTLEPCCHYGKNPPCTEAVIAAGIRKVYVGSDDPNPLVAGKGLQMLRDAGIAVETGVCKEECDRINRIFFHYITSKMPYGILKTAMTADGKTATRTGKSKWITNALSRAHVHHTRKRCAAILCGIGTVLADDPMLSCRCENPSHPVRVVCDSRLRIPLQSQIVRTAGVIPTYVASCSGDAEKAAALEACGVHVLRTDADADGHADLRALMQQLGAMQLDSVLIEGGAALHEAALRAGIVQLVQIYMAPMLFGGAEATPAISGRGVAEVSEAYRLSVPEITRLDGDLLLEYQMRR